jgi:hypothetical protein|tara:strand:- start:3215 stop:3397 length:183 start_codon:yes stop_codon:yes gene_type:complete
MAEKKIKKVDMSGLSKKQKSTMQKHSSHHSLDHMKYMIGAMRNGTSFSDSHKAAMKKIGK